MRGDPGAGRYAIAGVVLGAGFVLAAFLVLGATGRLVIHNGLLAGLAAAHRSEPLLYIIHFAPWVLGLFAWLVGVQQVRIQRFSASIQAEVETKTRDLQQALADTRRANETILHLAEHDALTGLFNRARIQKDLARWAEHARRYSRPVALMFVDLDHFKQVNDGFGHAAGDEYLRGVAERICASLRNTDAVGRWGGDEFAVVLPETDAQRAGEVGDKLIETLRATPLMAGGQEWCVSASVGIAVMPQDTRNADELIVFADAAMYQAKGAGGGTWRHYSSSSQELARVQERVRWEARLRRALETDQFIVHYQPVLDLVSGETVGYEALLRMEASDGALVEARLFLDYADQFDLSVAIDRMVIRKAMHRLASLAEQDSRVWVSVNLSRRALREPALADEVKELAKKVGVDLTRLSFEVSETMAALQEVEAMELMERLRGLGCRVILDDFGVGISALYALERFRVDFVKLDARLVHQVSQEASERLVTSLVEVSHGLGARVIAKCVEDCARIARLRHAGVDLVQGYAIGVPIEAIDPLVSSDCPHDLSVSDPRAAP
ncbi:EAL domain-containing protein [Ectothiorhodospiraceae bacterium 2226]|nr:EAL domain-containing protein [Ectothiorhodospiraceae bacterium 2226]